MLQKPELTCVGAKLNADKSEIICAENLAELILRAKCDFVWLGFSFKCTERNILEFTPDKLYGKEIKLLKTCQKLACLGFSYLGRLKIYNIYIRPIIELFSFNMNLIEHVERFQMKLVRALFQLPRCTKHIEITENLRIHPAEELMEKQAKRSYERHKEICDKLLVGGARTSRSGRERLPILSTNPKLRNDFFTVVRFHQESFDQNTYDRFKSRPQLSNENILTWVTRVRRRVKAIIKRSKAKGIVVRHRRNR